MSIPDYLQRQNMQIRRISDERRERQLQKQEGGGGDAVSSRGAEGKTPAAVDPSVALSFSDPLTMPNVQPAEVDPRFADVIVDRGALRPTGQWSVAHTIDEKKHTVSFGMIDELDAAAASVIADVDKAIVSVEEENRFKNKLMFHAKFKKTPKHLTWKELAQEIETLDCELDLDPNRPEEVYRMSFFFVHKRSGRRQLVWSASNDVSYSEGLTDLLAAVGSCLGRADVHRTIRFDSGKGEMRDLNIRKNSRYTSEVMLAFRPPTRYDMYERAEATNAWEKDMEEKQLSTWAGFHPSLMDPEYRDTDDPLGSYHMCLSAHAFSFVILRAIDRLLARPLKDFYRPSQVARTQPVSSSEDLGIVHAVLGWLGVEERVYPHYAPMEAVQDNWFGADAPFTLVAIVNKLREMTYLKRQNPEFQSWLATRRRDTAVAVRGIRAKLLGVGSSRLFMPTSYDPTVNRLLPKSQQRTIKAKVSIAAALGMPDQTKHIGELQKIARGDYKLSSSSSGDASDDGKQQQQQQQIGKQS